MCKKIIFLTSVVLVLALAGSNAWSKNLLVNGDFEEDIWVNYNGWNYDEPTGWDFIPQNDELNGLADATWYGEGGGLSCAWSTKDVGGYGIQQAVASPAIQQGTQYTFSFKGGVFSGGLGVNRAKVYVEYYWVSNPSDPWGGDYGLIESLSITQRRTVEWSSTSSGYTGTAEHAGKYFAVRCWADQDYGWWSEVVIDDGEEYTGPDITVDFATNIGPATQRFVGFINPTITATDPPDSMITPLKPEMIRTFAHYGEHLYDEPGSIFAPGVYARLHDDLGMTIQIMMSSTYGIHRLNETCWYDCTGDCWPGDNGDWTHYENFVSDVVTEVLSRGYTDIVYDLWNEPDNLLGGFWIRSRAQYIETWKRGYDAIKAVDASAVIAGPSFSLYRSNDENTIWTIGDWLTDIGAQYEPDILTWHEWGWDIRNLKKRIDYWDTQGFDVSINEYVYITEKADAGPIITFIADMERSDAKNACKSCWNEPGDGSCEWYGCLEPSLNSLLAGAKTAEYETRSIWWAYRRYADITGTLVDVSHVIPPLTGSEHNWLDAVAGKDSTNEYARTVIGLFKPSSPGTLEVLFDNMSSVSYLVSGGQVHVKVEHIPNSEYDAMSSPTVVIDTDYSVVSDQVTVDLSNVGARDAFAIELTAPSGGNPPGPATNPDPADDETGVSVDKVLSWTAGSGATSHDVYFGTASPPPFIQNQPGTIYNPGTMVASTAYNWRIDEKNAYGTTTGIEWSFTTAGACTPTDMHIEAVVCAEVSCGQGKKNGVATVTIYDDCGDPVTDALVDGTFTGDYGESFYDVPTDQNGDAVFTTAGCVRQPTFTFTVTDVTNSLPYDSNDNVTDNCGG